MLGKKSRKTAFACRHVTYPVPLFYHQSIAGDQRRPTVKEQAFRTKFALIPRSRNQLCILSMRHPNRPSKVVGWVLIAQRRAVHSMGRLRPSVKRQRGAIKVHKFTALEQAARNLAECSIEA